MTNKEIIKELENIEAQLNNDTLSTFAISDIRVDVALLIKELDEPHYVSGCGGQNTIKNEEIQIDGC
jgi:hypothetical protein|tara:strand:+ start:203 stop:403 length:201 start_codon:yes stop_codon:yes gene_type:complete